MEENMAANVDAGDVSEGVAASEGFNTEMPAGVPVVQADVTQTQAFAHRLREETERVRQEAAQQGRDAWVAEQGYEWNGKRIATEAEYKQALKEKEIRDRYMEQGLPEDVIQRLTKVDELEQWRAEVAERETQTRAERESGARQNAMYKQFLGDFPEYGSEEAWRNIPKEVFNDAQKWVKTNGLEGRRLSDAMANFLYRQNVKQAQTQTVNVMNAQASTGSVRGPGVPDGGFIGKETYEQNKGNQDWMMKNYDTLKKSMGRWK